MINTVIFDMDGVIFDTENALFECWMEAAEAYPVSGELVRETYIKCTGTNHAQTLDIYNNAFSPYLNEADRKKMWDESYGCFRAKYADKALPMKPGVVEVLEYLKNAGFRVGLASSTHKKLAEKELAAGGVLHYFESVTGGDAVRISKPNPEIYLIACDKMQVAPEECYAIEDSFNGVRAAAAAGMTPIMVPDMAQPDDEIRQLAETVCEDLLGVIDFLERTRQTEADR